MARLRNQTSRNTILKSVSFITLEETNPVKRNESTNDGSTNKFANEHYSLRLWNKISENSGMKTRGGGKRDESTTKNKQTQSHVVGL